MCTLSILLRVLRGVKWWTITKGAYLVNTAQYQRLPPNGGA
jgi:hypothetical protein